MAKITRIDKLQDNFYLGTKAIRHGKEVLENVLDNLSNKKDVYSLEETLTDKVWVNNKPIYRKGFTITLSSSATTQEITINISNVDTYINIYGQINNSSGALRTLPMVDKTISNIIRLDVSNNVIRVIHDDSWSGYSGYIFLEYTKK